MPMTIRTTIRWTDKEFNNVRKYANNHCLTLSEAIRDIVSRQIPADISHLV
jgi:hypothetical protein